MSSHAEHIKWFRDSAPYIDAHRGRTFVVCLAGAAMDSSKLEKLVSDFALLNTLGVKLVLVFNGDPAIDKILGEKWITGQRGPATSDEQIVSVSMVLGGLSHKLAAIFSASSPASPSQRREIQTTSGNFIKAQPIGIVDGMDYQHAGRVRKIQAPAIERHLEAGAIVLMPPIGFSPAGETFHLNAEAVACETACALAADKLIYLTDQAGLLDDRGELITEIDLSLPLEDSLTASPLLDHCNRACQQGVKRCHVLSYEADGALLEELFTRDGCGTQIVGHSYEQIRAAVNDDVPGILRLIRPLESQGILVARSREHIESEIDQFIVIERDGLVISCAALHVFDTAGELACLVTHPDYRNGDRGDRLLDAIERRAKHAGLAKLFVLTTQSTHWFMERGFESQSPDALPQARREQYNRVRGSAVLVKTI